MTHLINFDSFKESLRKALYQMADFRSGWGVALYLEDDHTVSVGSPMSDNSYQPDEVEIVRVKAFDIPDDYSTNDEYTEENAADDMFDDFFLKEYIDRVDGYVDDYGRNLFTFMNYVFQYDGHSVEDIKEIAKQHKNEWVYFLFEKDTRLMIEARYSEQDGFEWYPHRFEDYSVQITETSVVIDNKIKQVIDFVQMSNPNMHAAEIINIIMPDVKWVSLFHTETYYDVNPDEFLDTFKKMILNCEYNELDFNLKEIYEEVVTAELERWIEDDIIVPKVTNCIPFHKWDTYEQGDATDKQVAEHRVTLNLDEDDDLYYAMDVAHEDMIESALIEHYGSEEKAIVGLFEHGVHEDKI
jgi:hypothetical protein